MVRPARYRATKPTDNGHGTYGDEHRLPRPNQHADPWDYLGYELVESPAKAASNPAASGANKNRPISLHRGTWLHAVPPGNTSLLTDIKPSFDAGTEPSILSSSKRTGHVRSCALRLALNLRCRDDQKGVRCTPLWRALAAVTKDTVLPLNRSREPRSLYNSRVVRHE